MVTIVGVDEEVVEAGADVVGPDGRGGGSKVHVGPAIERVAEWDDEGGQKEELVLTLGLAAHALDLKGCSSFGLDDSRGLVALVDGRVGAVVVVAWQLL